jgi:hypothetical protein
LAWGSFSLDAPDYDVCVKADEIHLLFAIALAQLGDVLLDIFDLREVMPHHLR